MKEWKCKVCGYIHQGNEAPEHCPKCGAPKSQFYQTDKSKGCAMSFLPLFLMAVASLFILVECHSSVTVDNSVVKNFDVKRYLGKWYEIARFDHKFEREQTHCEATYVMQNDGTIKVTNRGLKDGKWKTSVGKGKISKNPGILRISFFGPFYSDYRILMVSSDYSYALVGGSSDKYLWILSRTPKLDQHTQNKIIAEARNRGYPTGNLIWVKHDPI